jgi:hypothetical protein
MSCNKDTSCTPASSPILTKANFNDICFSLITQVGTDYVYVKGNYVLTYSESTGRVKVTETIGGVSVVLYSSIITSNAELLAELNANGIDTECATVTCENYEYIVTAPEFSKIPLPPNFVNIQGIDCEGNTIDYTLENSVVEGPDISSIAICMNTDPTVLITGVGFIRVNIIPCT